MEYRSLHRSLLNRYSVEYRPSIGQVSTDVLTDISVDILVKTPKRYMIHLPLATKRRCFIAFYEIRVFVVPLEILASRYESAYL